MFKEIFSALPIALLFAAWLLLVLGFLNEMSKLPKF